MHNPRQKGLTLVELLVAISILGFVAVLGWRGLDGIVRARVAITEGLEQTRGMQLAFAQLQSDCAQLANASTLANRVPLDARQGRLTLVRAVYSDNQPSRLQVISYRVRDGVLTRLESAATRDLGEVDNYWRNAENDTDTGQAVVLQSDVAALTLRLWPADGSGWQMDAGASPPVISNLPVAAASAVVPTVTPAQPTGLEVTIQLQGRDTGMLKIFILGAV